MIKERICNHENKKKKKPLQNLLQKTSPTRIIQENLYEKGECKNILRKKKKYCRQITKPNIIGFFQQEKYLTKKN